MLLSRVRTLDGLFLIGEFFNKATIKANGKVHIEYCHLIENQNIFSNHPEFMISHVYCG